MFHVVGIIPGTPSRSLRNAHFMSNGGKWTVCPSVVGEKLSIKLEGKPDLAFRHFEETIVLFGPLFHSACHVGDAGNEVVCMTNRAKVTIRFYELFYHLYFKNNFVSF